MPCDTRLKPQQTIQERAAEVRTVVDLVAKAIAAGRIKVKVGATGGVTFDGLGGGERDNVTDGCLLRRLLSGTSATAKQAIARAEALAGRSIDKQAIAQGLHAHPDGNGGIAWHHHKG